MVADAQVAVLLTTDEFANTAPGGTPKLIIDGAAAYIGPTDFPASDIRPDHLAYVIYTSGSTGWPKGVAIEHRTATALVSWAHTEYDEADLRGVLAGTSPAFDLSIFELFVPLSRGGAVVLAESVLELPRLPGRDRVTLVNTVPSAMAELVAADAVPTGVTVVNLAGEPLTATLADSVLAPGTSGGSTTCTARPRTRPTPPARRWSAACGRRWAGRSPTAPPTSSIGAVNPRRSGWRGRSGSAGRGWPAAT